MLSGTIGENRRSRGGESNNDKSPGPGSEFGSTAGKNYVREEVIIDQKQNGKRIRSVGIIAVTLLLLLAACGRRQEVPDDGKQDASSVTEDTSSVTELKVFVAASLNSAMEELSGSYEAEHPGVKIVLNTDSSGKLMSQIEEGFAADLFFSAADKQMNELSDKGLLVEGSRTELLKNRLCVIARKDSKTKVTGLSTLQEAESLALADETVPVGRYTRLALGNLGLLPKDGAEKMKSAEIAEALGGLSISEESNVSKVLTAVLEGSCEVGTVYQSDLYGNEEELQVLETVPEELTGEINYPVAAVKNPEASESTAEEAGSFLQYLKSDGAKKVFESYGFSIAA